MQMGWWGMDCNWLKIKLNSELACILKSFFHFNLSVLLHTESLVKVAGIERTQYNTHSSQSPVCDNISSHPSSEIMLLKKQDFKDFDSWYVRC